MEEIIFKKKLKQVRQPKNDVEAVIRFMLHGDIKLTASQDSLCNRLMFVDSLIRGRKFTTDQMVEQLMEKFTISQYRAQQDMYDCQKVFGETRKLTKLYLLSHHIQEIGLTIQKCKDKDMMDMLPKLFDNFTYAINSLPEDNSIKEAPPSHITYIFNGTPPVAQEPLDDVLKKADKLLTTSKNGEYIEFEEDLESEPSADDGEDDQGE